MAASDALQGELLGAFAFSDDEWMDYDNLLIELSSFTDASEVDGLFCACLVCGVDPMLSPSIVDSYIAAEADQAEDLASLRTLLQRHLDWVRARSVPNEALAEGVRPLRFELNYFDDEAVNAFDGRLWLMGWREGIDAHSLPEDQDHRAKLMVDLLSYAARLAVQRIEGDEPELDELDEADFELLDGEEWAASEELMRISTGVAMTLDLIPRILAALLERDEALRDQALFELDAEVYEANEELQSEEETLLEDQGMGLYGARMDWLRGLEERLDPGFFDAPEGAISYPEQQQLVADWTEHAEANGGLPFEFVDGFLSAVSVSPGTDQMSADALLGPLFVELPDAVVNAHALRLAKGLRAYLALIPLRAEDGSSEQAQGIPAFIDRHLERSDEEIESRLGERWANGFRNGMSMFCPDLHSLAERDRLMLALLAPLMQMSGNLPDLDLSLSLLERRQVLASLPELLRDIRDRIASLAHTPIRKLAKIGRNDPCPCGSGKKYKKCCGAS